VTAETYDAATLGLATLVQHALDDDRDLERRAEALVVLACHDSYASCGHRHDTDDRMWTLLLSLAPSWTPGLWADLCRYCAEYHDVHTRIDRLEDDPDAIDAYIDGPVRDRGGYREQVLDGLRSDQQQLLAEEMTVARWMVTLSGDTPAVTP
jgi:hypothetical protein